ncbi:hypothetical protein L596_022943 [Steinernema carpocapsae]|uniref:Uncharacterized protein n=1 Tax=Steinernema carpocapsae TaxID=34508 RepID=A0A4U5MC29_STECR|nr:hypothetical protein L596_022943 [Steinernema carpocapsae]
MRGEVLGTCGTTLLHAPPKNCLSVAGPAAAGWNGRRCAPPGAAVVLREIRIFFCNVCTEMFPISEIRGAGIDFRASRDANLRFRKRANLGILGFLRCARTRRVSFAAADFVWRGTGAIFKFWFLEPALLFERREAIGKLEKKCKILTSKRSWDDGCSGDAMWKEINAVY